MTERELLYTVQCYNELRLIIVTVTVTSVILWYITVQYILYTLLHTVTLCDVVAILFRRPDNDAFFAYPSALLVDQIRQVVIGSELPGESPCTPHSGIPHVGISRNYAAILCMSRDMAT